ncbi:MAG: ketoacyl-ACP synthase III [Acidobacteriota bacterium]
MTATPDGARHRLQRAHGARYATILSTAAALPKRRVTNADLVEHLARAGAGERDKLAETIGKLEAATHIRQRWWAGDGVASSDLALVAARRAIAAAGLEPTDIDLILLGTDSPDYTTPSTSVVLQHKLGATGAGTFDVGCACASFPTALAAAAGLIATNPALRHVLVVGAYMMHKLAADDDPTLFFYGDGAGAAVLGVSDTPGFVASAFQADGSYHDRWGIYAGGTAEPASVEAVRAGRTNVRFIERYPPEVNHEGWPRLVRKLAADGGFAVDDIDVALFTQVRKPSIELVMEALGLPLERTHTIMEEQGYTGSACVPMVLHDAREQGKIRSGDLVVLVGSGVGFNQAAAALVMP